MDLLGVLEVGCLTEERCLEGCARSGSGDRTRDRNSVASCARTSLTPFSRTLDPPRKQSMLTLYPRPTTRPRDVLSSTDS